MPSLLLQVELDSAQFVTRTYVTTYTLVETSTSKEHVVSNVATEQLSPAGATSTPLSSGQYQLAHFHVCTHECVLVKYTRTSVYSAILLN